MTTASDGERLRTVESVRNLASEMTRKACDGDRASGYLRLVTAEVLQSAWDRLGGWE